MSSSRSYISRVNLHYLSFSSTQADQVFTHSVVPDILGADTEPENTLRDKAFTVTPSHSLLFPRLFLRYSSLRSGLLLRNGLRRISAIQTPQTSILA